MNAKKLLNKLEAKVSTMTFGNEVKFELVGDSIQMILLDDASTVASYSASCYNSNSYYAESGLEKSLDKMINKAGFYAYFNDGNEIVIESN